MDRPNDPGGASSTSPPIIVVQDIPTVPARKVPTMPARAERAAQHSAQDDVEMAVLGKAAHTAEKLRGSSDDGGAAARRKPDIAE
eukprot:6734242-Heterocapsa_arctica.AAC.1